MQAFQDVLLPDPFVAGNKSQDRVQRANSQRIMVGDRNARWREGVSVCNMMWLPSCLSST